MISIDKYAYTSKLRAIEPLQKLIFALLTLSVGLWADSLFISVSIFIIMTYATVKCGGTPLKYFIRLLLIPIAFLIISVSAVAIDVSVMPQDFIVSFSIQKLCIGVSESGLSEAMLLFFKTIASVTCLYFLALSTPIIDLLTVLRSLKVPKSIVEITGLVYKFIFILLETADNIFTAQNSRLGYVNITTAYRSFGILASTLFIRSYKRANNVYIALEARCYDEELNVLEERFEKNNKIYLFSVIVNSLLILAAILLRY